MRINSILLKNFLSHNESKIEFKGNINVIIGPNGAGKSAIIDGIIFSLFRKNNRASKNEELIKKGKSEATVELNLQLGNKQFLIIRKISYSSSASTNDLLIEIGQNNSRTIVARSASEVRSKILEYFKIPDDVLLNTIIIPQGKIEDVIEKLADVMKKVLKLEKLEKLIDSRGPIKYLIKDLESKRNQIETYKIEYNNKIKLKRELEEKEKELEMEKNRIGRELEEKEKELESLRRVLDELQEKEKEYNVLIAKYSRLVDEIRKKENEVNKLELEVKGVEELEEVEKKLEEYKRKRDRIAELKRIRSEIRENEEKVAYLRQKVEEYESKLREKEELRKYYQEYVNKLKILENLQDHYERYKHIRIILEENEKERDIIKDEIEKIRVSEEEVEKIEKELEVLREDFGVIERLIGEKNGRKVEIEKIRANLASVKGNKCPVCGRELSEEHKSKLLIEVERELRDIDKELYRLNLERDSLKRKIKLKEKELTEKRESLEKKKNLEKKLNEVERKIEELKGELEILKENYEKYIQIEKELEILKENYEKYLKLENYNMKELEGLKRELEMTLKKIEELRVILSSSETTEEEESEEELERKVKELEFRRKELYKKKEIKGRLDKLKEDLELLYKEKKEYEDEIKNLNFEEKEYKSIKEKKEKIERELNILYSNLAKINGQISEIHASIERYNEEIKRLEEKIKDENKYIQAINKLERLRKLLGENGLQAFLIDASKRIIENNLNEIISKFDLSISRIEIDVQNKYQLYAISNTGEKIPAIQLSGGEKVALSIALRLSIAKAILSDIGFVIMDEPTVHLDSHRKQELLNIIRLSSEVVPQIIIVTHDQEVVNVADYVIRVEKRAESSVVEVEKGD